MESSRIDHDSITHVCRLGDVPSVALVAYP